MKTQVVVHYSVEKKLKSGKMICLQDCTWMYSDGSTESGFRFIRKSVDGKLLAHRGQACIPKIKIASDLINEMENLLESEK